MVKSKKIEKQPSKRAVNALMKFFEVAESGEILFKTGAFYQKETLRYFKRLINALKNLQKHGDLYTDKEIKKVKVEANRLLDKEMKRIKYIHSAASYLSLIIFVKI